MSQLMVAFFALSAAAVALALFLATFIGRRFSQGGWGIFPGLLVGKDNRISLSKFQGVIWTLVTVTSFITLKITNVYCGVPINTDIPPNLLVLLGLNGATMVLAKGITSYSTTKGHLKLASASSSLSDLYMADDSQHPDVMKFQMLCWTVVALAVYFINFFSQCGAQVSSLGFPDVEGPLVYLMVIGQGAYLGDKVLNINKPRISGVIPLQIRPGEPFSIMGNLAGEATTFILNGSVPLEVIGWSVSADGLTSARALIPGGHGVKSSPAALTATAGGMITNPYYVDIDLEGL